MKKTLLLGTLGLFLLGACHSHSADEHAGHDHEAEEAHGGSNEIVLTPDKAKAAGVTVSEVQPGTFHRVIKTSGQVLAAQGDERVAVAPVSGVVNLRGRVIEGMRVASGEALLTLSSNQMAEGDPVEKARVAYETARKEYERMEALLPDRIVSEKDFARAREAYENARISYEAVAKNQTAGGQVVTAPIGGYVKSLLVKEGDYVTVGQPLATISRDGRLMMRADVPARYYRSLPDIRTANFKMPYDTTVYRLEDLKGRLLSYGRASGGAGFYVPVTFELDNRGGLIPGSFVEIYLLTRPLENVLSVPTSALIEEQGIYSVYVRVHEEHYRKQEVTLGASDGANVQILSGLSAGDEVVTRGAYQIKLSSASNAIPAHTHHH